MSTVSPFRDVIVSDARTDEPVVAGLNDQPLRVLRQRFAALVHGQTPRPLQRADRALLVASEGPGYGKSHLISRLFRELHGQASLISIQPFQNASTAFQSLMLSLIRELHFPDRESTGSWDRDAPSQLDLLAHSVLAHLVADLIEGAVPGFIIESEPDAAAVMRAAPLETFARGQNEWADWLQRHWTLLEKAFEPAMARRGLEVRHADAWLRVLRTYAFAPFEPVIRRLCTEWMCGQPLDSEEALRIGLRASDAISGEVSPEETNRTCHERLREIGELSCFFRPFIFCFDQTEVYCGSPALAHSFGTLIATLVNEVRGHLVLVTANQRPWTDRLLPHMEDADQQRIEQPPLLLEGLNRAQARELTRLRMTRVGRDDTEITRFLGGPWFTALFPAETSQLGARAFLQKCNEAWTGHVETPDLETLFDERRDHILATPKRHVFEPDRLQWLVEDAARGIEGIEVASVREKYAAVQWRTAGQTCFFGFLPGSHWKQWLAVARTSRWRRDRETPPAKYIFFRVPGQPPIPGANWRAREEIERARESSLHLVMLTRSELAELYAPRDLYAEAAQGDIPFTPEQVLAYIRQRLAPLWERLAAPLAPTSVPPEPASVSEDDEIPQPDALAAEVRSIVERARFLSVDEVLAKLGRSGPTREAVLAAAGFCSEIRLHTHPKMTVLQWQPRG